MQHGVFYRKLQQVYKSGHFLRFDVFIVHKFSEVSRKQELTEDIRKTAFRQFQKCIGQAEIANVTTMRRWFGISGFAKPTRAHIFQIAFLLGLDKEETEEYLTRGIGEPSFQISDYNEIIYLYGIENHLDFDKCQQMIHMFEKNLMVDQKLSTTRSTEQLKCEYEEKKNLPISEFLLFVNDNITYFKGYSNTALSYLLTYRDQVLRYIRQDAQRQLERWLAETDYNEWKRKQWFGDRKDSYRVIQKYLRARQNGMLSETIIENVKELSKLAYSTLCNNSLVHSELFFDQLDNGNRGRYEVKNMTMKHLSDLLNVAYQKECRVKIIAALGKLEMLQGDEKCPDDIGKLLKTLMKGKCVDLRCDEAKIWLAEYDKEHKRRQLDVQRSDLLPFVLYVSQQKYMEQMEQTGSIYDAKKAKEMFTQSANDVLTACNMQPLSEERELDTVLIACYQEDEMYGYADVLEALYG